MRAVHATANLKNARQPRFPPKVTVVQDWQTAVHDEQTPLKPRGRAVPPRRTSDRPLHLQGSLGVSTGYSASSTSSFDWDQDGESVLPESVIAAAEREGMC